MSDLNEVIDRISENITVENEEEYNPKLDKEKEIKRLGAIRQKTRQNDPSGFARHLGIENRHVDCTIENYDGPKEFLKEWEKDKTNNILITGKKGGNGKTHLAVGLMKYIGINYPVDRQDTYYESRLAADIIFTTFTELMMDIRSTYSNDYMSDVDLIKKYSEIPYLFIDDIGAEKTTEHTVSILYMIINKRYVKMLPTITTTNMDSKEMALAYHQRIVSRLASGVVVKIEGKDRRLNLEKVF